MTTCQGLLGLGSGLVAGLADRAAALFAQPDGGCAQRRTPQVPKAKGHGAGTASSWVYGWRCAGVFAHEAIALLLRSLAC